MATVEECLRRGIFLADGNEGGDAGARCGLVGWLVSMVLSLLELCGSYVFLLAVGIRTALQKAQLSTVRNIQRAFGRT